MSDSLAEQERLHVVDTANALLGQNAFDLFGLIVDFEIDLQQLNLRYHELQRQYHPDNYCQDRQLQGLMVGLSAHVNSCYNQLTHVILRALLVLQLNGVELDLTKDTQLPQQFLLQQLEIQEQLADIAGDIDQLTDFVANLRQQYLHLIEQLAQYLAQQQFSLAADLIKQIVFYDKLLQRINDQLY